MRKKLCVVGGGPKAAALAARVASRHVLGKAYPHLLIMDDHPGGHWSGNHGFSDGEQLLCTFAEKDVGFPYDTVAAEKDIDEKVFQEFSWQAYRIATNRWGDYVDRGRPFPTHSQWADYIRWVMKEAALMAPGIVKNVACRVESIARHNTGWRVTDANGSHHDVDGVVVTGPGPANRSPATSAPKAFDCVNYWQDRDQIKARIDAEAARARSSGEALPDPVNVCVIGGGGTAGAIIADLIRRFGGSLLAIQSLSTQGVLFPRGDGYAERRFFTDPIDTGWLDLSAEHRRNILERTEVAVISAQNKQLIDRYEHLHFHAGRATGIQQNHDGFDVSVTYGGTAQPVIACDFVILAIGFSFMDHLRALWAGCPKMNVQQVEQGIRQDLSIDHSIAKHLHVPALAGLQQGPGFVTLGCLGHLAQRILSSYV